MDLNEAIKHCEEKAKELRKEAEHERQNQLNKVKMFNGYFPADYTKANDCIECANEHQQLAEWLKDYKRLLEERPQSKLNNAIKTIKAICKDNNTCNICPMNWNCNEQPAKWEEVKGGTE